jgi:hypothetical protein
VDSKLLLVAVVSVLAFAWFNGDGRGGSYADAVATAAEARGFSGRPPVQRGLGRMERRPFQIGDHTLSPVATFDVRGLVLGSKRYRWDRAADLIPVDLALGWGAMTDADLLSRMTITQGGRFYRWRYPSGAGVRNATVIANSSNMHMIPSTPEIGKILASVREGDIVRIRGKLVNVSHVSGWHMHSSTSRTDTGAGACEVVWITSIEVDFDRSSSGQV